jgi:hypothetical protein
MNGDTEAAVMQSTDANDRGGSRLILATILFLIAFFFFAFQFLSFPALPDGDSYYHLAVARLYATNGMVQHSLSWARLSVLGQHFGDKEYLFHVFLMPFVSLMDGATGGRLALAILNALVVSVLGWVAAARIGAFGWLVPLLIYLAAPAFLLRVDRLRPELAALLLLIVLIEAVSRRQTVLAGVAGLAFALTYTAFQLAAGIVVLVCVADYVVSRRPSWKSGLASLGGIAGGLLIHPDFPWNLRIWWIQNIVFFLRKGNLDVGGEIQRPSIGSLLLKNWPWWLAIAALIFIAICSRRRSAKAPPTSRLVAYLVATAVTLVLQLMMKRMSIYFIPFATLTAILAIDQSFATQKRWRRSIAAILLVCSILAFPMAVGTTAWLRAYSEGGSPGWERDLEQMGRRLPGGARVAAPWGAAEFYVYWAPQARYLNVLDPVFMDVRDPLRYALQRRLFEGREPSVEAALRSLDSNYIAFDQRGASPALIQAVHADPGIIVLYDGANFLGKLR